MSLLTGLPAQIADQGSRMTRGVEWKGRVKRLTANLVLVDGTS
jgi:hypothetical protein